MLNRELSGIIIQFPIGLFFSEVVTLDIDGPKWSNDAA